VAKVTATGTLSALVTVQVGSQVSGRVQALYADFNSQVKKGQRIARIDPQLFEAAVAQARANHLAAQGNLAKARAQAVDAARQRDRARALAEKKLVAQAELDTAQATAEMAEAGVEAARGSVEQARAALHQAEVNLAFTDIVSPTSGVVISRNVDVGQTVAASLQAPTIFVIAEDLAKMQVNTSVAEADVGRLRDGMDASFTVDAYPSEVFRGKVRQIRNSPQTVQNVVTYDAVVDVENPELKLRPGMTANVTFVYAQKDDVLRVPNAALRFRPPPEMLAAQPANANANARPAGQPPDRRTVWVLRGGTPATVAIRSGISDGSFTEVVEGELQPGDEVVTDATGGSRGLPAALRRGL
jgi:HlyD family secretion protein